MSSRKLVSAIVGVGYWGKNYVRILSELKEDTELICVCDLIPQAVAAFKQQYPELNTTTSVKEMLTQFPQIDLVVVVTPATTHFAVVKEILEAKKHVLVEKPLTIDIKQGQDLCKIAEANGVFLMCGHTFLFNKGIHKMKELMQEKEFGTPYVMYAKRTALGPIRFDVGADWDLVPHDVSIIQYLLNDEKPSTISAIGNNVLKSNKGLIDNVFITITYPSGLIANIHASWVDPEKIRQFVVVGSGRRIVFDDMNAAERVRYIDNGATEVAQEGGAAKIVTNAQQTKYTAPAIAPFEPLKDQVKHFFQSIRENTKPTSDGKFGVVVVQIMQGIVQSIAQGGIPLSFESIEKQTQ